MKDGSNIAQKEGALPHLAGESLARARQELLKTGCEQQSFPLKRPRSSPSSINECKGSFKIFGP
jgi:hypothetical protein